MGHAENCERKLRIFKKQGRWRGIEKCAACVLSSTLLKIQNIEKRKPGCPESGHIWESATCAFQSGIMCIARRRRRVLGLRHRQMFTKLITIYSELCVLQILRGTERSIKCPIADEGWSESAALSGRPIVKLTILKDYEGLIRISGVARPQLGLPGDFGKSFTRLCWGLITPGCRTAFWVFLVNKVYAAAASLGPINNSPTP